MQRSLNIISRAAAARAAFVVVMAALAAVLAAPAFAAETGEKIALPKPDMTMPATLMQALSDRRATRDFTGDALAIEDLSGLLWAAGGVNRESGGRTYPTALGRKDIALYAVTPDGAYKYLPETHELERVADGDHRAEAGHQAYVAKSAAVLLYAQETEVWSDRGGVPIELFGGAHAAFMAQNAALYSAARGLGCVVIASFRDKEMSELLGLDKGVRIRLAECVGVIGGK